jgi:DNA-binding MarR family transcriptional regulator
VSDRSRSEQLDAEILDCVSQLLRRMIGLVETTAQRMCVPTPFIKALHLLERPMAMKDLGHLMHCDPSFVTVVADMLEKRGLARREPQPGDRRVRNLVLTGDGLELKHQIEAELAARMPWRRLTEDERAQLVMLVRKMLIAEDAAAAADPPVSADAAGPSPRPAAGEVEETLSAAAARTS